MEQGELSIETSDSILKTPAKMFSKSAVDFREKVPVVRLGCNTGSIVQVPELFVCGLLHAPSTTRSISATAEDLCFADSSSFSRAFKRESGYTPARRGRLCPPERSSARALKTAGRPRAPISAISCAGSSIPKLVPAAPSPAAKIGTPGIVGGFQALPGCPG